MKIFLMASIFQQLFRTGVASWKMTHKNKHVNDLPDHILRDIGWLDPYDEQAPTQVKKAEQNRA